MFPLLAALPDAGPTPGWTAALLALPPLVAAVAVYRTLRSYPTSRWDEAALRGVGAGLACAVGFAVLAAALRRRGRSRAGWPTWARSCSRCSSTGSRRSASAVSSDPSWPPRRPPPYRRSVSGTSTITGRCRPSPAGIRRERASPAASTALVLRDIAPRTLMRTRWCGFHRIVRMRSRRTAPCRCRCPARSRAHGLLAVGSRPAGRPASAPRCPGPSGRVTTLWSSGSESSVLPSVPPPWRPGPSRSGTSTPGRARGRPRAGRCAARWRPGAGSRSAAPRWPGGPHGRP